MGESPFQSPFDQWAAVQMMAGNITSREVSLMRSAWQEAVKQEREAILAAIDDLEDPAWYGYENPNNFDDGKRACAAAIRARLVGPVSAQP